MMREPGYRRQGSSSEVSQPRVLLITGTAGSGKTAVALDIGSILPQKGLSVAVLDIDWLGWAWLGPNGDECVEQLRMRNLAAVWPNFRAAGVRHLVLAHAVRSSGEVESVRKAVHGADLDIVRLAVSPEVVSERLRGRDAGVVLEAHLEIAPAIARDLDKADVEDFYVHNEDRTIRAVALEVLHLIGWIGE